MRTNIIKFLIFFSIPFIIISAFILKSNHPDKRFSINPISIEKLNNEEVISENEHTKIPVIINKEKEPEKANTKLSKESLKIITQNQPEASTETETKEPKVITEKDSVVTYNTQDIVKTWRPYVVRVTCIFLDTNGNKKSYSDGSGFLSKGINGPIIITNRHVFRHKNISSDYCDVYFPESKEIVRVEKKDRSVNSKGYDLGILSLNQPSNYVLNLIKNDVVTSKDCATKPDSKDRIVILGYPKGSSKEDVSYKEGQLIDYKDYYFISTATMIEGYSGGVAISTDKNCFIGTPSALKEDDLSKSLIIDVAKF